jgi:peptidoglycan/xylan/chitin deacetylase (PgdA/CDA1 family)
MATGLVFLMYHEIETAGRATCQSDAGYVRYVVKQSDFKQQLARLRASGLRGMSVTEALTLSADSNEGGAGVVLTFDDGCETDFTVAAPMIAEAGSKATFYVVAGFLGRRGYLSHNQLRELSDSGFEIGCHSMTHSYLTGISTDRLRVEVAESKERLEQVTGKRVAHFSCPGGRWSRTVARAAEEAGYDSVATSRVGVNSKACDRFSLSRIAVMRSVTPRQFDRICRGEGLMISRARTTVLTVAKSVLGNSIYERGRSSVLSEN